MMDRVIGVIGDYDPRNTTHLATTAALDGLALRFTWIPTDAVRERWDEVRRLDGIFVAPASPYRDMDAVLDVIRHARESGVPLVGT